MEIVRRIAKESQMAPGMEINGLWPTVGRNEVSFALARYRKMGYRKRLEKECGDFRKCEENVIFRNGLDSTDID